MYGDKGIWYIEIRRDLSIMTLPLRLPYSTRKTVLLC